MKRNPTSASGSYLFQVEVLVNADSNGAALEHLLNAMNKGRFADYRIQSGIELGQIIEQTLAESPRTAPIPIDSEPKPAPVSAGKPPSTPASRRIVSDEALDARIQGYIASNKLIRINVNKGRGVKLSIPCRVVNYDPEDSLLTVYHVDEKKVYSIRLNEIDDFVE